MLMKCSEMGQPLFFWIKPYKIVDDFIAVDIAFCKKSVRYVHFLNIWQIVLEFRCRIGIALDYPVFAGD